MGGAIRKKGLESLRYLRAFLFWAFVAVCIGVVCGLVGGAFSISIEHATHLRRSYPWLVYCMPLAGICIAGLYRLLGLPLGLGTDEIIKTVRTQEPVSLKMAPAIFISTALTHLTGGSAGREGAALQLGGSIGVGMSRMTGRSGDNRRICELCGMAALFSALFGTPLAATLFVIEIIEVGKINDRALLPCLIAALTAKLTACAIGAPAELFPMAYSAMGADAITLVRAGAMGICCGAAAIVFCGVMHFFGRHIRSLLPNDFVRVVIGGVAIAGLSFALGTTDYQGSGMPVILRALQGEAVSTAFLWKIVFTAITLGCGFKGGEIVPSFFIGATLGCVFAPIVGLDAGLGAALGIIGMFCEVTNAPLASMMLSVELFGVDHIALFGIVAAISFALSGQVSLYHTQLFVEPKMGHRD